MSYKSLVLAVASLALTACYHVSVVYNPPGPAQASAATVVDVPWSHGFVAGLVPPAEVNTKGKRWMEPGSVHRFVFSRVREPGLEPGSLAAQDPKSCAFASSATPAQQKGARS